MNLDVSYSSEAAVWLKSVPAAIVMAWVIQGIGPDDMMRAKFGDIRDKYEYYTTIHELVLATGLPASEVKNAIRILEEHSLFEVHAQPFDLGHNGKICVKDVLFFKRILQKPEDDFVFTEWDKRLTELEEM